MRASDHDDIFGASHAFLRTLRLPVVASDRTGTIVRASEAVAALLGTTPVDLEGLPIEDVLPGFERASVATHRNHVASAEVAAGPPVDFTIDGQRADGTVLPLGVVTGSRLTRDGEIVLSLVVDYSLVSAVASAREEVRRAARRASDCALLLARTQRLTGSGHFVTDGRSESIVLSPVLQELVGASSPRVAKDVALGWLAPEDRKRVASACATGTIDRIGLLDVQMTSASGAERHLLGTLEQGPDGRCFGVFRDVTEARAASVVV